jgi:hypothetical protein
MEFTDKELELIRRAQWRVTQSISLRGFCLALMLTAIGLFVSEIITAEMLAGACVGLVGFACVCPRWAPSPPTYAELVDLLASKSGDRATDPLGVALQQGSGPRS